MPVEELHKSEGAALRVTAAPNLTSFGRLCRSAIDHRHSTLVNAQSARVVNLGSTGYGAVHNPLRRGIGDGKNNIYPPRSGDLKTKGGLSYTTGGSWIPENDGSFEQNRV